MDRGCVANRIWRAWILRRGLDHPRGIGAATSSRTAKHDWVEHGWSDSYLAWNSGSEATVSSVDPFGSRDLEPGLLGAECRKRSCLPLNSRRTTGRCLANYRS